jgi:hypothetical protein
MNLDQTFTLRQLVMAYNKPLIQEMIITWTLGDLVHRTYTVREQGAPTRPTNEPGELLRIKDGAYKSRQRVASLLYSLAKDDPELTGFVANMGKKAQAMCSKLGKLTEQEMLAKLKTLKPEVYL